MSRVRLGYALAFLGILITTGGCGSSATAPEAASVDGFAAAKAAGDSVITSETSTGGDMTTMSSGFLTSGGRSDDGSLNQP